MSSVNKAHNHQISKAKSVLFVLAINYEEAQIHSPIISSVYLCLQLLVLHYYYVNPSYSWLQNSPILATYFASVFPNLFFIHNRYPPASIQKQQPLMIQQIPFILLAYSICGIILIIVSSLSKPSEVTVLGKIISLLLKIGPIFVARITLQFLAILGMFREGVNILIPIILGIFVIPGMISVLFSIIYHRIIINKILQILIITFLCLEIRYEPILATLGLKIVLALWKDDCFGRYIKIGFQSSLYVSVIILMFVPHSQINFIMLAAVLGVATLSPIYNIYFEIISKDISQSTQEEQANCSVSKFTYDELVYIKKTNRHIKSCQLLHCFCHSFKKVSSPLQLRKWARSFNKQYQKQKVDKQGAFIYGQICLKEQELNLIGFLNILNKQPANFSQQYKKFKLLRNYKQLIKNKQVKIRHQPILEKGIHTFDSTPDIIKLENMVSQLFQKLIRFWKNLLKRSIDQKILLVLIDQIANQIVQIEELYCKYQEEYQQNHQIETIYKIFRYIILNDAEGSQIETEKQYLSEIRKIYFILTCDKNICNISSNVTTLLQKEREKIIGSDYTKYMSREYANNHHIWVEKYLQQYQQQSKTHLLKLIFIDAIKIKPVNMQHVIIPFTQGGISFMTCVNFLKRPTRNEKDEKIETNIFHILVTKIGLDIIAFQEQMLDCFNINSNPDLNAKIIKSTLTDIFPNINQECLNRLKSKSQKTFTKPNLYFFQESQTQKKVEFVLEPCKTHLRKQSDNLYQYEVNEVKLPKSEQFGFILIRFDQFNIIHENNVQMSMKRIGQTLNSLKMLQNQQCIEESVNTQYKTIERLLYCLKIVLGISLFCSLSFTISSFVVKDLFRSELQEEFKNIQSENFFFEEILKTSLFYFGAEVGADDLHEIRDLWSLNEKYGKIIVEFEQANSEIFLDESERQKIIEREKQLNNGINNLIESYQVNFQQKKLFMIIILCIAGISIIINFITNCILFIHTEKNAYEATRTLFFFDKNQISKNLRNLITLQKNIGLKNYECLPSHQHTKVKENKNIAFNETDPHNSDIHLIKKDEQNRNTQDIFMSRKIRFTTESDDNEQQTTKIKLDREKKEEFSFYDCSPQHMPDEQENHWLYLCGNIKQFLTAILNFMLMVSIIVLLLLIYNEYSSREFESQNYEIKIGWEPIFILLKIEQLYLGSDLTGSRSLNELYYENFRLMNSLSDDFKPFQQYENQMNKKNLCDLQLPSEIKDRCNRNEYLFEAGPAPTLQYISEFMRKIKIKQISEEQLMKQNQFSLAINVILNLYKIRIQTYRNNLQKFYEHYETILNIEKGITAFIIVVFLCLQYRSVKYILERGKKTETLFKIIPQHLKGMKKKDKAKMIKKKPLHQKLLSIKTSRSQIETPTPLKQSIK